MSRAAAPIAAKVSTKSQPRRGTTPPLEAERDPAPVQPAHAERVREAAYFIYERKGRVQGLELENWLEAEAELLSGQAAQRGSSSR